MLIIYRYDNIDIKRVDAEDGNNGAKDRSNSLAQTIFCCGPIEIRSDVT
jgi:hypothetical protein